MPTTSTEPNPFPVDTANVSVPPKRKGGRTSRWAMKKNKQKPTDNHKPKESDIIQTETVPLDPPTPPLEIENLSTLVEDFKDPERDPENMDLAEQITCQETEGNNKLDTILLSNCDEGRKRWQSQVQFQDETTTDEDFMLCPNYGEKATNIPGPFEEANSNIEGGGALCLKDVTDTRFLDAAGGVLTFEERECHDDGGRNVVRVGDRTESEVLYMDKIVETNEDKTDSTAALDIGEWYSVGSDFDDNWDWESVVQLNNDRVCDEPWDAKDKLLAWLWKDDDLESVSQESGEIDHEKQNAMVAWFLS